jgi:hypothetical protein
MPIGASIAAKPIMHLIQMMNRVRPVCVPEKTEVQAALLFRSLKSWLAPDMALTFALTIVLALFFMFGGANALFNDADTGWHIRNGERILSTGLLPHADPFSFSKSGQSWVAWEWGSDVLMGAVNRAFGLGGVALMYGLAIGAAVWMWFRLNRAAGGNCLLAGLSFIPMSPTASLHWLARPHIFSWLFLLGMVWFCEQMPRRIGWRQLALVAFLSAAWANLHASFFFAPLIALIYAAGTYLTPLIWEDREIPVLENSGSRGRAFILVALAAVIGSFANPYGWQLHRHVFSYLSNSGLLDHISEFQSFDFHIDGAFEVVLMLTLCFAGAFAALAAHKPERFLLSMFLTAAALRSARALPMAGLLVLPLANGSITAVLSSAAHLTPGLRRGLDGTLDYGDRLHAIERRFRGFALIPLAAILIFASIRTRAGFSGDRFPVAAAATIDLLPVNARIFASDTFGGYLIYRFNGERKVFFDGRSDFYGTQFIERYLRLMEARPGWRKEFRRWNFTHALLSPDDPLLPALEANGWNELYRDHTAVVLTGKSTL